MLPPDQKARRLGREPEQAKASFSFPDADIWPQLTSAGTCQPQYKQSPAQQRPRLSGRQGREANCPTVHTGPAPTSKSGSFCQEQQARGRGFGRCHPAHPYPAQAPNPAASRLFSGAVLRSGRLAQGQEEVAKKGGMVRAEVLLAASVAPTATPVRGCSPLHPVECSPRPPCARLPRQGHGPHS